MRSLVREEKNEVKYAVISLGMKINTVTAELAGRLDEEAMARQDLQNNVGLNSFGERPGRLELPPPLAEDDHTGDIGLDIFLEPDVRRHRRLAPGDGQRNHREGEQRVVEHAPAGHARLVSAPLCAEEVRRHREDQTRHRRPE